MIINTLGMTNSAFQGGERLLSSLTALAIHLIARSHLIKSEWLKPWVDLTPELRLERRS